MHTHLPSPRLSPEQSGIVMVVVYFVTAFWVAMIWNIPHHASSFHFSSLGVGMCGGIFSVYHLSRLMDIAYVPAANFLSFVLIAYVFLWFCSRKTYSKKRRCKSASIGCHNWSRRRVLWLQMKISRTEYVRLASKNKTGATKSLQTKDTQTTCASDFVSSVKSSKPAVTGDIKKKTSFR